MPTVATMACLINPVVDLPPVVGLLAPILVPRFWDIPSCDHILPRELQPLIENLVWVFNLVGAVTSRVILIY